MKTIWRCVTEQWSLVSSRPRNRLICHETHRPDPQALTIDGISDGIWEDLSTLIRHRFTDPRQTLEELFGRLVFNILVGNTDDHARNHAAFWDGRDLTLTPAYDICPQGRTGREATQAMLITGNKRLSQLTLCLEAASQFLLHADRARTIITSQLATIRIHWNQVCDEAGLTEVDRAFLWGRQFFNPFALQGWFATQMK